MYFCHFDANLSSMNWQSRSYDVATCNGPSAYLVITASVQVVISIPLTSQSVCNMVEIIIMRFLVNSTRMQRRRGLARVRVQTPRQKSMSPQ